MVALFSEFRLKDVRLRNRIVVSPMCQYQAEDGFANDWHFAHYAGLARGGSALVVVEATGVTPEGRITPGCLGLWTDDQVDGLRRIADMIRAAGAVPGIQLAHAGRKAGILRPWEAKGDTQLPEDDPRAWQSLAPSAIALGPKLPRPPRAMTLADIAATEAAFADAALRAKEAGFDWLELHCAHGFLAQSFFSTTANRRSDAYGGDFAGRSRFLLETLAAVRAVWPERLPLSLKFGCREFDGRDEERKDEVLALAKAFKAGGLDLMDASIGFTEEGNRIPWGPGMMVPTAAWLRRETGLPTGVSWNVAAPDMAEWIVAAGQADLVYIAKALLADPHYPWRMAQALGLKDPYRVLPAQYAYWLDGYRSPA